MDTQIVADLGLVLFFILLGGIFAATEIALVSLRSSQVDSLAGQGRRGARVAALARDPNRFLAAVQIGVTVAGFFSASYGATTLAPTVAPLLVAAGLPRGAAHTVALVAMTLFIAYLSLVLGELVPKRLALQNAARVSLVVAPVLDGFATVMKPAVWVLSRSTDALVRLVGGDPTSGGDEPTEEEVRALVAGHQTLGEHERTILADVFAAGDRVVEEVMRPRADVVFLRSGMSVREASALVGSGPYSRYPVIGEGVDDVVGVLHVRELLRPGDQDRPVADLLAPVVLLPGTLPLLSALAELRTRRRHLAVVVDEYGGTDGIVTLEDLVEELVGEIHDEYDAEPEERVVGGEGRPVELDAGMTLEEFTAAMGIPLEDGRYETVAGFVLSRLHRIAEVGDRVGVDDEDAQLEVAEVVGHRITRVRLLRPAPVEVSESRAPGRPR